MGRSATKKFVPSSPDQVKARAEKAKSRVASPSPELSPAIHTFDMFVQCLTRYQNASIPSRPGHSSAKAETADRLIGDEQVEFARLSKDGDTPAVRSAKAAKALGLTGHQVEELVHLAEGRTSPSANALRAWAAEFLTRYAS